MQIIRSPFTGSADFPAMQNLARTWRTSHLHTTDLPWRLNSWALDDPGNAALWRTDAGELVAWATLQTPFWTLDEVLHAEYAAELLPELLAWADERIRAIANTEYGHECWFSLAFADQPEHIQALEACGWASQAEVGEDSWSKVWMKQTGPLPAAPLPPGFTLQPLGNRINEYVDLQRAVFESKNMTVPWRQRTTTDPAYTPGCDLVVVAPDGRLAAFCVGWLEGSHGQIEPLGVHADFRSLGLGKAVLAEGLRQLAAHGAQEIHVETDNFRNAALDLYEWAGFRVERNVLVFRKDYA